MELPTPASTPQPHCALHPRFAPACATCRQAVANVQPYPVRKDLEPARSFGFTDDLTPEKLRSLDPRLSNLYADDPELSLSLAAIRFLRRLIWPF